MKRYLFSGAAAVLCAGSLVAAQAPASPAQQAPSQPQPGAQGDRTTTQATAGAGATTVTGCVYKEEDVPGRTPNVAERAGVLEDYILADVRMGAGGSATGTSGAAGAGAVGSTGAGAASTTGQASSGSGMYKLELVDDDKLEGLVGKRVEVTGRIDREAGDAGGRPQGTTGLGGAATGSAGAADRPGAAPGAGAGDRPGAPAAGAGAPGAQAGQTGQADRSIGPDRIELPEFEVTSIREIAGTCPATPSGR